jgi:hypothetical protein
MEKICTRCNFRTPAGRAVCQVCGHSKFHPTASAVAAIPANNSLDNIELPQLSMRGLSDALSQLAATASSVVEKLTETAKAEFAKYEALCAKAATERETPTALKQVTRSANLAVAPARDTAANFAPTTPSFGENEDLETMISWFKSYGVDRPLILESRGTEIPRTESKAA